MQQLFPKLKPMTQAAIGSFSILLLISSQLVAQNLVTGQTEIDSQYQLLMDSHRNAFTSLAEKCEELDRKELAAYTRKWIFDRDPSRDYFF